MNSIDRIYIDIDGVLANFITDALITAGIPLSHNEVHEWEFYLPWMTKEKFYKKIDDTRWFWKDLAEYVWAKELFYACREIAPVFFCSTPSKNNHCASEKLEWLRDHGFMKTGENNFILTPHKDHLAAPGRVLIDDSTENLYKFSKAGGCSVMFPQPWNTQDIPADIVQSLMKDRVKSVIESLRSLFSSESAEQPCETKKVENPKDSIGQRKPGLSAIPVGPLYEVGAVLAYGGRKYGNHNWRSTPIRASVYYDAAIGHLTSWWEGENLDPVEAGGSGLPHVAHAMAGLMACRDAEMMGNMLDDRPLQTGVKQGRSCPTLNAAMGEIINRYPLPVKAFTQVQ